MAELAGRLTSWIRQWSSCAVAFSGGVDSAVVAKAAHEALGDQAVAVTGVSASLADGELENARAVAGQIGIRHTEIRTDEFQQAEYRRNAPDRCYHCKTELYHQLERRMPELGVAVIFSGANADDLGDYRPGLQAAAEHHVRNPLAENGIDKQQVRELARLWNLPVWDKPASPCLSSRLAYGQEVTPERLRMVDLAEQFLRAEGLNTVRVRYHGGDLARIEVPVDRVAQLVEPPLRDALMARLTELGFRFVTLDLEGFRSGSLNALVELDLTPKA